MRLTFSITAQSKVQALRLQLKSISIMVAQSTVQVLRLQLKSKFIISSFTTTDYETMRFVLSDVLDTVWPTLWAKDVRGSVRYRACRYSTQTLITVSLALVVVACFSCIYITVSHMLMLVVVTRMFICLWCYALLYIHV